jgi:PAS domain S-box-containing protein
VGPAAARAYLCLGALALAVYFSLGGNDGIYQALGLAAAGVVLLSTAYRRPAAWPAWVGIGVSQLLFAVGDIVYGGSSPFPGPADVTYSAGYLVSIGAIVTLLAIEAQGHDVGSHLDAVLATTAVGVALATLFVHGIDGGSTLGNVLTIGYPLADLVLLGLLIRVAFLPGRRPAAYWLLVLSVILLVVADCTYLLPDFIDTYGLGGWADAGWLGSYVLVGAAALHPSMSTLAVAAEDTNLTVPLRRVVLLGCAILAIPIAVIVEDAWRGDVNVLLVASAGTVIVVCIVVRVALLVRQLAQLRLRAERSEQKFRMVFEGSPIGISIGRGGMMSETNPALQRMLGYTGAEFAALHYTEVTHPDDLKLGLQAELDAGKRRSFSVDKRYVRKDGGMVDAHVHVALELEGDLGISLIEDVTGRHELEEQLRQAQKMEAIGKLAGGVAHDFNNLMTAVIGYSDLLLRQLDANDSKRSKVDSIRDAAVRASDLTRQLLAFGRRQVMRTTDIDLREVVGRMESLLRRVIGEDVRLETIMASEPVLVRADATQVEQVVMNLAVNARDAMPAGGTLTIAVLAEDADALLVVGDNGDGMDESVAARIFEPFFTTKPVGKGTGLGLATVYGIVGQSGGEIEVQTAVGQGTVFRIRLPGAAADGSLLAPEPAASLVD